MRIRQPLSRSWRVGLGVSAMVVLVLTYGWLAHRRQVQKRALATVQWQRVARQITELDSRLAAANGSEEMTQLNSQRDNLVEAAARLRQESENAEDRTVPTWHSLYRDGVLRVLQPQGLNRNEYWLWEDARASFGRLCCGLSLGVALSVVIGLLMGCYTSIEALLMPPFALLAKIPPTAMLAVFFVLVGTQFEMYLAMLAFGTLPTFAQTVFQSAKNDVPDELIQKADTLGASQLELITNVILPQVLPRLIDAVRLQVGPAMVLLVAAEWMVAGAGFGYRLRLFFQRTDMTVVFVYLIVLGFVGLIIDQALIWTRRTLCPWFGNGE